MTFIGEVASVLSVRLSAEQKAALDELSQQTGRSKSYYVKRALDEFLEDRADYLIALAVLENKEPTYSLDEARRELGL